jgi:glucan phosphorylase
MKARSPETPPAMAVAELMRILLGQAGLGWDNGWDLTTRTLAYTDHTLPPEALEKWPVQLFQLFMPRHLELIYEAGEDNFCLFGLTAEKVRASRGWYNPHWHYEHELDLRYALDMIRDTAFSHTEPGGFTPIWDTLITHGDHYMHLAALSVYPRAQEKVGVLYRRPQEWARKAILNAGRCGKFSSDRTIAEYSPDIWRVNPCPMQ